jgi:hypothetical protein
VFRLVVDSDRVSWFDGTLLFRIVFWIRVWIDGSKEDSILEFVGEQRPDDSAE